MECFHFPTTSKAKKFYFPGKVEGDIVSSLHAGNHGVAHSCVKDKFQRVGAVDENRYNDEIVDHLEAYISLFGFNLFEMQMDQVVLSHASRNRTEHKNGDENTDDRLPIMLIILAVD